MSEARSEPLNIREQVARIDREQAKIQTLLAEAAKMGRDRALAPWRLVVGGMATGAALFAAGMVAAAALFGT